jgi:phenylalanyl-tRNA synthetase beta chain
LREFVDIPVSPRELAERLTAAGIAVDTVTDVGDKMKGVITARLSGVRPHPNADRLSICSADAGGEVYEIVTAADNVFTGAVVPLALEGARLADGTVIKKARFRGIASMGMLCSEVELGLEDRSPGIMILPPDTPPGTDIAALLGLPDTVLAFDLTPNRGDCLSILGIAREVAVLYGLQLNYPPVLESEGDEAAGYIDVEIRDPQLCGRYAARVFEDIKIGQAPLRLQTRLRLAGMRPIYNLVDVTNYVMLELGQPLHAFDYETLRGRRIVVRRASPGERLVTLDGVTRQFDREDLLIADAERAVAVAGVMGGLETEVTPGTATVLLESANFDPLSIRKTSRKLGLRSEASLRFEKRVDIEGAVRAAGRMARLVAETGMGRVVPGVVDSYTVRPDQKTVVVRPDRLDQIIGASVPGDKAVKWLKALGFGVRKNTDRLIVSVPTFRPDVSIEEDIAEEVARLYGYDRIAATQTYGEATPGRRPPVETFIRWVNRFLTGLGLTEVVTYSFINPMSFDLLRLPQDDPLRRVVALKNPISEEQSVLRATLLPGMLEVVCRNVSRRVTDIAVFEAGRVFKPRADGELPDEPLKLGMAVAGKEPRGWESPPRDMDFYFLKGIVEALLDRLGIDAVFRPLQTHPSLHPMRAAGVLAGDKELGYLGQVHPEIKMSLDLPNDVILAEFDIERLLAVRKVAAFRELVRFPGVLRDIAVVVPEGVPAAELVDNVKTAGGELLRELRLFDVYKGAKLPECTRSIAFSLLFQAGDRTLTDTEAAACVEAIVNRLKEKCGAVLRW